MYVMQYELFAILLMLSFCSAAQQIMPSVELGGLEAEAGRGNVNAQVSTCKLLWWAGAYFRKSTSSI